MYASVIVWTYAPGALDDVRGYAEDALVPLLRDQPGFRSYLALRTGRDAYVTIVVHETREHAEAGFGALMPVLRRYWAESVEGMDRYAGEVEVVAGVDMGAGTGGSGWQFAVGPATDGDR